MASHSVEYEFRQLESFLMKYSYICYIVYMLFLSFLEFFEKNDFFEKNELRKCHLTPWIKSIDRIFLFGRETVRYKLHENGFKSQNERMEHLRI